MKILIDDIGDGSIERARKLLSGIPGGAEKAIKAALTRAASHLRTNAEKAVQERYDISKKNLRSDKNVGVKYVYSGGTVSAYINFSGVKIPLYRYGGASPKEPTPDKSKGRVPAPINGVTKMVYPGIAASGHQLKTSGVTHFEHAFTARMKSGHVGIFERTGGATAAGGDEIKELMGSSFPQMLGNEEVAEKLSKEAYEKFEERLDHEILAVMNGWSR